MPLTTEDRVKISAQLLSTPALLAQADADIAAEQAEVDSIQQTDDNVNRPIFDALNAPPLPYMREARYLDGNVRRELVHQDFLDAAAFKTGNLFFPNRADVTMPSIPGNVWANPTPFALSGAIGKNASEGYAFDEANETTAMEGLEELFVAIEAKDEIVRVTGQGCVFDAGDPPTIPATSTVGPDSDMQAKASQALAFVADWKTALNAELLVIQQAPTPDPDAGRQAANDVAYAAVLATLAAIAPWEALDTFETGITGVVGSCALFGAQDPDDFGPTKFRATHLPILKDAVTARKAFVDGTRLPQIAGYLGSISQDASTGAVTALSGMYGARWPIINVRLNLILGGNLSEIAGKKNTQKAAASGKQGTTDLFSAWSPLLAATEIVAPTTGTGYVQVKDSSAFAQGDAVFLCSDEQPEIARTVELVEGDRLLLDAAVPPKYRPDEGARLYKEL
jgi:hypothetical protein